MTEQKKAKAEVDQRGHLKGSRKGRVHAAFEENGSDVAWTLGQKLRLKPSTLRSWFHSWGGSKSKPKAKPAPKAKAKPKGKAKPEAKAEPAPKSNGAETATAA